MTFYKISLVIKVKEKKKKIFIKIILFQHGLSSNPLQTNITFVIIKNEYDPIKRNFI